MNNFWYGFSQQLEKVAFLPALGAAAMRLGSRALPAIGRAYGKLPSGVRKVAPYAAGGAALSVPGVSALLKRRNTTSHGYENVQGPPPGIGGM